MPASLIPLLLATCACANVGALLGTQPNAGVLGTGVTQTVALRAHTQYVIDRDDIEILGPVQCEGEIHNVLLLVAIGDSGYSQCLDEARRRGADAIIDLKEDRQYLNILFVLYGGTKTRIDGTAIRWRNARRDGLKPKPRSTGP